jgi:hypothetical protein
VRRRGIFVLVPILNGSGTTSWMVRGTKMDGTRISPTFKTEVEALQEKQRLENEALNNEVPTVLQARCDAGDEHVTVFEAHP